MTYPPVIKTQSHLYPFISYPFRSFYIHLYLFISMIQSLDFPLPREIARGYTPKPDGP